MYKIKLLCNYYIGNYLESVLRKTIAYWRKYVELSRTVTHPTRLQNGA